MIAAAIIWFFCVLAWDIITDYNKWLKSRDINHTKEWWLRVALLIPSTILFTIPMSYDLPLFLAVMLAPVFMQAFVWWLLFDGIYNKLRGFGWWFNGSDDGANKDSKLDIFLMRLKDWQEAVLKIGLAAGSIILYIKL